MKFLIATVITLIVAQAQAEKLNFNELILDVQESRKAVHETLIKEEPNHRLDQVREKKVQKIDTQDDLKQKRDGSKEIEDLFSYQEGYQKKSIKKQSLQKIGSEFEASQSY